MSITKQLALRHLKQNKTRSVLTVLGITISVVMLTVIFTCATSFAHYYGEKAINENGNWHFFVKTDYESAKKYLLSDSSLKDIGFNKDLSTEEQSYKIYSNKANYLRVGTIYQGDKQYIKDTVTCKYDGTLPQADNEIMVEQSLIKNNGLDLKIGDEIKITTSYGEYTYKIYDMELINETDVDKLPIQRDKEILMIYTCYPFNNIGYATQRYVVYAELEK